MAEDPRDEETAPEEPEQNTSEAEPASPEFEPAAPEEPETKPGFEGLQGIDTAQVWIAGFLVLIVAVIAYSNAFSIPFHYLDQRVIVDNANAHRIATVPQALSVQPSAPLPMLTYAANWVISGGSPGLFHAINILLHALNALLVFLVCRRLLPRGTPEPVPMLAGLFVALNPVATESVDYVVGRSGLLLAFFSLLAILLFVRASEREEGFGIGPLALSLSSMLLAWYCNHVAALIPVFVLVVDWILHGRHALRRVVVHAAYWGLLGVLLVVWFAGQPRTPDFQELVSSAPQATNVDRAAAFMDGLESTLSPTALTVDHNLPPRVSSDIVRDQSVHAGLTLLTGMVILGVAVLFITYRSMVGLGLLWFVAGLAWTTLSFSASAPFSERGLYFPLCGLVMVVPWLVAKASAQRVTQLAAAAAAVILLIASGSGTFLRNRVWLDPQSLWQDAAIDTQTAAFPLERLGQLYYDKAVDAIREGADLAQKGQKPAAAGKEEEAQQLFIAAQDSLSTARERNPENAETLYLLGRCASFLGKRDDAVDLIRDALWRDPGNFDYTAQLALNLLARANTTGGMNDRLLAIDYFRRAEQLGTLPPELRTQLAALLGATGDLDAAEKELRDIVSTTKYAPAEKQLENVRRTMTALNKLEQQARTQLQRDPQSLEGMQLEAEVLLGRGQLIQASYLLSQMLADHPGDAKAWIVMGVCRAMAEDEQGFLNHWPQAPATEAGQPSAWMQLAQRCGAMGRWNAARAYLEAAAGKTPEAALPLVSLAKIAMSMKAVSLADQYLNEATQKYPDSPAPWLVLCDIAVASDNLSAARRYLDEAEKRGATGPEIEQRRAKVGTAPVEEKKNEFNTILR